MEIAVAVASRYLAVDRNVRKLTILRALRLKLHMQLRSLALLGLAAVAGASASPQPELPTVDEVLARYTQALGGAAAIEGVRSRAMTGCYLPTRETPCVPFEVYSVAPDLWKTVMISPGILRMERIANASGAWDQTASTTRSMRPEAAFGQALAFHFPASLRPRRFFAQLSVVSADDKMVVLEGRSPTGQSARLQFDPSSGLLTRIGDYLLADYRPVGGVLAPFEIRSASTGTVYRFKLVEHNREIPAGRFGEKTNPALLRADMAAMRAPALDEALRGLDATPKERRMLAELDFFSPHEGRMLFDFIRLRGYKHGLEIGTGWGNSTLWLAMALKRNGGKLITVDREAAFAKRAQENFAKAGLSDAIESRVNEGAAEISSLAEEFDLVFMDTGANIHRSLLDAVRGKVTPGGAIISHNADTFERDQPDFRQAVMEDPELETSLILTPGGGMSVSVRRTRASETTALPQRR